MLYPLELPCCDCPFSPCDYKTNTLSIFGKLPHNTVVVLLTSELRHCDWHGTRLPLFS